jgi:Holliday junction resolvasome RuvABC DNA-binding subunit
VEYAGLPSATKEPPAPDIAGVLKQEIRRLAKKEIKAQLTALVAVRGIGKRTALRKLAEFRPKKREAAAADGKFSLRSVS